MCSVCEFITYPKHVLSLWLQSVDLQLVLHRMGRATIWGTKTISWNHMEVSWRKRTMLESLHIFNRNFDDVGQKLGDDWSSGKTDWSFTVALPAAYNRCQEMSHTQLSRSWFCQTRPQYGSNTLSRSVRLPKLLGVMVWSLAIVKQHSRHKRN